MESKARNNEATEALQAVRSIEERSAAAPLPWALIVATAASMGAATFFAKQGMWPWTLAGFAAALTLTVFSIRRSRGVRVAMKQPVRADKISTWGALFPLLIIPLMVMTPLGVTWISAVVGLLVFALMLFAQIKEFRASERTGLR